MERWRTDEPALEPAPRVVLVPGVGMWTVGPTPRAAALARDIYLHTVGIMAGAEALGGYRSLPEGDGFRAEYWPLELYKLTLAPPERELAGRVALVTGAAGALGGRSRCAWPPRARWWWPPTWVAPPWSRSPRRSWSGRARAPRSPCRWT